MDWCSAEVAVILDGEFGDRLATVSSRGAVWVVGSATNQSMVEELRRGETPYGITTFKYEPRLSGAEAFAAILPTIDEHHGSRSCDPPYQRLVVYGAGLNAAAKRALKTFDFRPEEETLDGFTAIAGSAA